MKRILIIAVLFTLASCETKQQKIEKQIEKLDKLVLDKLAQNYGALTNGTENSLYVVEDNDKIIDRAQHQRDSLKYELELLKKQ